MKCPGSVARWVGALFCVPKGCRFEPWSGHGLEATDQCLMFLSLSLSLSLSLPPSPDSCLSLKSVNISLGEERKKKNLPCIMYQ